MRKSILSKEQEKEILKLYSSGISMKNIGFKFDVSKQTISRALKRNFIENKSPYAISIEKEMEIIELYKEFKSVPIISQKFKVSNTAIYNILKRNNIKRENKKYVIDESFFDIINTQEKAYILGLFMADGYNSKDGYTLGINLKEEDKDLLERVKIEMKTDRPLYFIEKKIKNKNHSNSYALEITNKNLCESANKAGIIKNKTYNLKFPNIDNELLNHFIRGYFDGDGCIYISKENKVTVSIILSESFCDIMKIKLKNVLGFSGNIYQDKRINEKIKIWQLGGNKQCKTFMDWIYKDSKIFMKRKKNKYNSVFYSKSS
jgi:predicted DNA-binding protein YlxM (UPF0122 family)